MASGHIESPVASVPTPTSDAYSDPVTSKWRKTINALTYAYVAQQEIRQIEDTITNKFEILSQLRPTSKLPTRAELEANESEKRKALEMKLKEFEKQLSDLGFWSFAIRITGEDETKHISDALPQIEENVQKLQRLLDGVAKDSREEKKNAQQDTEIAQLKDDSGLGLGSEEALLLAEENRTRVEALAKLVEKVKTSNFLEELTELVDEAEEFMEQETVRRADLKIKLEQFVEDLRYVCEEKSHLVSAESLESRIHNIRQQTSKFPENVSKIMTEHQRLESQHGETHEKTRLLVEELKMVSRNLASPAHTIISQKDREGLVKNISDDIQMVIDEKLVEGTAKITANHSQLKTLVMGELRGTMERANALKNDKC